MASYPPRRLPYRDGTHTLEVSGDGGGFQRKRARWGCRVASAESGVQRRERSQLTFMLRAFLSECCAMLSASLSLLLAHPASCMMHGGPPPSTLM